MHQRYVNWPVNTHFGLDFISHSLFVLLIAQRHGGSLIFASHSAKRVAPARFRTLDYVERNG